MKKAAPLPMFWFLDQAPPYRIPVNVPELFNPLSFAPHIEVVVPFLPERITFGQT
jgi:hypothetical protein